MINTVNITNIRLDGCGHSVRKEMEAIHDSYLEKRDEPGNVVSTKKQSDLIKRLFLFTKVLHRNIKPKN